MKKIGILGMFLVVQVSVGALAQSEEIGIAKSNFWQAPYNKVMQLKVETKDHSVNKECADFKNILIDKEGSDKLSSNSVDSLRQLPAEDSMSDSFFVTFALKDSFVKELTESLPPEKKSSIPGFSQATSVLKLDPALNGFEIVYDNSSLSAITDSLGLERLPIKFIFLAGKPVIKIFGRDTVCDFLDKKALLKAKASASVTLPQKAQIELSNFYTAVEEQINSVLVLKEGNILKASRLGYRLSSLISPSTSYSEDVEKSTLALFKLLFKENSLDHSSVWGNFDDKPILSPVGTAVKVPVNVELSL